MKTGWLWWIMKAKNGPGKPGQFVKLEDLKYDILFAASGGNAGFFVFDESLPALSPRVLWREVRGWMLNGAILFNLMRSHG